MKPYLNKFLYCLLLVATSAFANTYTATGSGNWTAITWACTGTCSAYPGSGDTAIVSSFTVTAATSTTVAALNITGTGIIAISGGVTLNVTGDITANMSGPTATCSITMANGSTLQMGTRYHGTSTWNYSPVCTSGTLAGGTTITGGYFIFDGFGSGGGGSGGITATYTAFVGVGDSTHSLSQIFTNASNPSGNNWNVTNSTFTNCGLIYAYQFSSITHSHNVHTLTAGNSPFYTEINIGSTFNITFDVFDKNFGHDPSGNVGIISGATITDNYFGGGILSSGTATSWARNHVRYSDEDGSSIYGGLSGCSNLTSTIWFKDDAGSSGAGEHTHIDMLCNSSLTMTGIIIDSSQVSNTVSNQTNDGFVNSSFYNGQLITIETSIVLPGADGVGVSSILDTTNGTVAGTCADAGGTNTGPCNFWAVNHDTVFAPLIAAIDNEPEAPVVQVQGNRGTITNNIFYATASGSDNFLTTDNDVATYGASKQDLWSPTSISYNGIYNMTATNPTYSSEFSNQANSVALNCSVTPNTSHLVTTSPAFYDPGRNTVTFDSAYLAKTSPTYTATNFAWFSSTVVPYVYTSAYTSGTCVSSASSGYYANTPLYYCATQNVPASTSIPGIGSVSRQYWEFKSNADLRNCVANGTTITDASLGLSGATCNQAIQAWISKGMSPTNVAYHTTASDGGDIGAVAYTSTASVPVVSGIQVDDVTFNGGHSCARFTWNSDLTPVYPAYQRVSYCTENGGSCTGSAPTYTQWMQVFGGTAATTGQQEEICGNTPGSTVHFCPQTLGSSGWSSCTGLDQVVTFPAAPSAITVTLPNTVAQPYPNTTGYPTYTLNSTCSDLNSTSAFGDPLGHINGRIVYLPTGGCTGNFVILPANEGAGGVQPIISSNISTGNGTITLAGHGFILNQTVYLAASYTQNPSSVGGALPAGFLSMPVMYYVVNPTTNTFQLSLTSSGSPVVPSNQGYGAEWISPTIPLGTAEIILRSSAADSALPPPNVRLDPVAYASSLAVLQSTCANNSATCYYSTVQMQPFVHHIRIGPGVEITSTPYFVSQTNQFDSANQRYLWSQGNLQTWSNIVFDRMWLHGQPCPDRTIFGIQADGSNIEIDSSVIDNISVCRPNYNGLAVTDTSSSLSIASGTYYFLTSTQTVASGIGATVSGTASGTVYVTLPTGSATPKVYAPSGTTIVCTGCTGVASTLAGFPVDANGRYTEGPIASIPITSGVLGSPVQAIDLSNIVFVWDASQLSAVGGCTIGCTEGGLGIDVVIGPGPMRVTNTYFYNDIGIAYFIEDTGAAQGYSLADYLTYRNTFQIDPVWSPSNVATNHLNACNRNIFEEKTGQRMAVIGNTFTGNYSYCTPGGYAVILAANNAASSVSVPPVAQMADLTAAYNTIMNSSGGIEVTDIQGTPAPHVPRRVLLHDNVISVNGYQHMSSAPSSFYNAYGVGLYLGIGGEDWTVNHNTLYNVGGYQPAAILWEWSKQEGVNITNNLFIDIGQDATKNIISSDGLTTQGLNHAIPSCYGLTGKLAMDCSFTPSYNFLGNVLSVGYTNTQAGTGEPGDPTMGGAYTGTDASNTVRVESTVALRNAAIGFQSVSAGNYRFSRLSPYLGNTHPATDSTPIGVNQDALDQAQGTIYNLRPLLVTSSGATLYMTVPDAGASCWIRYGTGADLTVYAQTAADTTASRYRAISVTGLSPSTQYTFYGECAKASNTPSVTFSTL